MDPSGRMECNFFVNDPGDQLFNQFFETADIHSGEVFILNHVVGHGDWSIASSEANEANEVDAIMRGTEVEALAAVGL